jgi:hypothetical protein
MNKRTKLLAEKAGLKVESWMTNPPKPFQILGSVEQFEKFAELIVRQCADVAWMNTPETEELEYSHLIEDKILKHFGVE